MNLSIVSIKKSQLNASNASAQTKEASKKQVNNQKKDFTGVPEAEAQAEAIKKQKSTSSARTNRKVTDKSKSSKESKKSEVAKKSEKKEKEPTKKTTPKLQIVHYSEKSIALFGDTKPIKEELKKLGGRFNANLRPFDSESRVPGWIFPKKVEDELKKLIK